AARPNRPRFGCHYPPMGEAPRRTQGTRPPVDVASPLTAGTRSRPRERHVKRPRRIADLKWSLAADKDSVNNQSGWARIGLSGASRGPPRPRNSCARLRSEGGEHARDLDGLRAERRERFLQPSALHRDPRRHAARDAERREEVDAAVERGGER